MLHALIDRLAARLCVWGLNRLFGVCPPPHDPDCLACASARLIDACRSVLADEI
jgi:hypothetical protein